MSMPAVSAEVFKEALAQFASGVTLVTAHTDEYGDVGSTVTAFCSVSAEPPLVLASIATFSRMFDTMDVQPLWAVAVLSAEQRHVAARFAAAQRPGGGVLLTGVPHHRGAHTDALVVDGALASLECRTTQRVEAGDHTLFVGEVLGVGELGGGEPLVRFAHRYR